MGEKNLFQLFETSYKLYPNNIALDIDNHSYTYKEILKIVQSIAYIIKERNCSEYHLCGIIGEKTLSLYSGILAILYSGNGYLPLNNQFPAERNLYMFLEGDCNILISSNESINNVYEITKEIDKSIAIILPEYKEPKSTLPFRKNCTTYTFQDLVEYNYVGNYQDTDPYEYAYMLFTSGSTGKPKAIGINHSNVLSYLEYVKNRYLPNSNDKFSQTFDLTFDLSVHDIFLCWSSGASLIPLPKKYLYVPNFYIKTNKITFWFSVPSLIKSMKRLRMLKKAEFPSLRFSLFCGEPLPIDIVDEWRQSAINSVIENLYGPTETTIAISHYRINGNNYVNESINGIVPIGGIFKNHRFKVVDNDNTEVKRGEIGELLIAGSQVAHNYFKNEEKSKESFIVLESVEPNIWYKTGDLVKENEQHCISFIGRKDHQIKINGYRIEPGEIEFQLKTITLSEVIVLPFPKDSVNIEMLVAVLTSQDNQNEKELKDFCQKFLPEYMIPKKFFFIDEFPLNTNGKINRQILYELLNL